MSDVAARLLVFSLGDERFAVPLAAVDEVVEMPPVHRLPDASAEVLGIATLGGELVSIYDPRSVLHAGDGSYGVALLFTTGNRRVGIAINDFFDPILIEADELRSAPGMDAADGMLKGVVRRGTNLIGILDAGALLTMLSATEGENE